MKINKLETHDRLLTFKKDQEANIFQGAEDCLKKNPLSLAIQARSPYVYLFAHPRTHDDGVTKKMYWQPRLSKPKAQTNSYLFRALSHSDTVEICWLIPPREMWSQYQKGKVVESNEICWSINQFENNRESLERNDPSDMTEEHGKIVLQKIIQDHREQIRKSKLKPSALIFPSLH